MKQNSFSKKQHIEFLCDSLNVSSYYYSVCTDIVKKVKKNLKADHLFQDTEEYKYLNTQFFANFALSLLTLDSLIDGQNKKSYKEFSLSVYHSEFGFELCQKYIEIKKMYRRSQLQKIRNKIIAHNENIPGATGYIHLGRITKAYFSKLSILKKYLLIVEAFMRDEFRTDFRKYPSLSEFRGI